MDDTGYSNWVGLRCTKSINFNLTGVQLDDAVGGVKVMVIMADDNEQLALRFQLRQQRAIKDGAKFRVLAGGPLVKEIDRAIFQVGCQ